MHTYCLRGLDPGLNPTDEHVAFPVCCTIFLPARSPCGRSRHGRPLPCFSVRLVVLPVNLVVSRRHACIAPNYITKTYALTTTRNYVERIQREKNSHFRAEEEVYVEFIKVLCDNRTPPAAPTDGHAANCQSSGLQFMHMGEVPQHVGLERHAAKSCDSALIKLAIPLCRII